MRIVSSLAALALALAGCSDGGVPGSQDDGSASFDFGIRLDFTQPAPDLSATRDFAVLVDLAPPADFSGVQCGNMTCAQGKVCCASVVNQMLVQSCETSCNSDAGNFTVACDGPEDCKGNPCCVKVSIGGGGMQMGGGATCENAPNACQIGIVGGFTTRLCHQNADCAGLTIPLLGTPAQCCHEKSQPNVSLCAAPLNFMGFNFTCP